jgi:hypothetical protein
MFQRNDVRGSFHLDPFIWHFSNFNTVLFSVLFCTVNVWGFKYSSCYLHYVHFTYIYDCCLCNGDNRPILLFIQIIWIFGYPYQSSATLIRINRTLPYYEPDRSLNYSQILTLKPMTNIQSAIAQTIWNS